MIWKKINKPRCAFISDSPFFYVSWCKTFTVQLLKQKKTCTDYKQKKSFDIFCFSTDKVQRFKSSATASLYFFLPLKQTRCFSYFQIFPPS